MITGPLWRVLENIDIHILDMEVFIEEILENLQLASRNIEHFIDEIIVFSSNKKGL